MRPPHVEHGPMSRNPPLPDDMLTILKLSHRKINVYTPILAIVGLGSLE